MAQAEKETLAQTERANLAQKEKEILYNETV
jgi:hypothetical protein